MVYYWPKTVQNLIFNFDFTLFTVINPVSGFLNLRYIFLNQWFVMFLFQYIIVIEVNYS